MAHRFRQAGIPFFIWLHPERTELNKGEYNNEGKEIIAFCNKDSVPVIEGINYMSVDDYRDAIHLNEKGQAILALHLCKYLEK